MGGGPGVGIASDSPPRRRRAREIRASEDMLARTEGLVAVAIPAAMRSSSAAAFALATWSTPEPTNAAPADPGLSARVRMRYFDGLPRPIRDIANEYNMPVVVTCLEAGIRDPNQIRDLAREDLRLRQIQSDGIYGKIVKLR